MQPMNIKQIRIKNLEALVEEAGSAAELARRSDTSAAYLSQIFTGTQTASGSSRGVGSKLARKIESGMDRPEGWMDKEHTDLARASNDKILLIDANNAYAWRRKEMPDNFISEHKSFVTYKAENTTDRTYALEYTGPKLMQFAVIRSPCTLIIDPDEYQGYPASVWLIDGAVVLGEHEQFGEDHFLEFHDGRPKKQLDTNKDKCLGWLAGIIIPKLAIEKKLGFQFKKPLL